jgi:predicted ATPase
MANNEDLRLSENQWKVLHEVMQKIWETMNGIRTMPPNFPKEVINALDENIRILYFDLLRLYDITDVLERAALQPFFRGLFGSLNELLAVPAETLKNGDFAYLTVPVAPETTANI